MSKPKRKTYYGSGTMYEFPVPAALKDSSGNVTLPATLAEMATFISTYGTEDNQIGFLKGGFQVQITTEKLEDQSDLGEMKVSVITKEEGTMTFGLFNSCGETISRLYPTAHTVNGVTTVGGLANASQDDHVILFVGAQKDDSGEQTAFVALGKNTEGFSLNWNPDSVEPFSCNYSIVPFNTDGNMFRSFDISQLPNLPISSDTVFSIFYEVNGGEWAAGYEAPDSYTTTGDDVTLPTSSNISKTGKTFGGWFESTDLATAVTEIDVSETVGNKTFIAKWT